MYFEVFLKYFLKSQIRNGYVEGYWVFSNNLYQKFNLGKHFLYFGVMTMQFGVKCAYLYIVFLLLFNEIVQLNRKTFIHVL